MEGCYFRHFLLALCLSNYQMPIREACHVAIQRSDPTKQKLWKHAQARQLANGAVPVVQIVCMVNYTSLYCT